MHISTLLFSGREAYGADLQATLACTLRASHAHLPALRQAHVYLVMRHIATDSVTPSQASIPVVQRCAEVEVIVECAFEDAAAAAENAMLPAWRWFLAHAGKAGTLLYVIEATSNVSIPLARQAEDGGFRRLMFLRRAAADPKRFHDAWFGRHAELVRNLPFVDGYLQNLVLACQDSDLQDLPYATLSVDGIAHLCFAGEEDMLAAYASEARLPLREDGRLLLDGVDTLLVHGVAR